MSFTEFTYRTFQGYDFLHLLPKLRLQDGRFEPVGQHHHRHRTHTPYCIRRDACQPARSSLRPMAESLAKLNRATFGLTTTPHHTVFTPVLAQRFGRRCSKIHQDSLPCFLKRRWMRLFAQRPETPHLRTLQKKLAEEVTVMVHSRADYESYW